MLSKIPQSQGAALKWYLGQNADYSDLEDFYKITKEVGRGANGVVYKACCLDPLTKQETDGNVAIKAMYCTVYPIFLLLELYFLSLVKNSPNVVQFQGWIFKGTQLFFITDFYENMPLEEIKYPGTEEVPKGISLAPMKDIKDYLFALLEGLATLHELGIIHRDIKPGNFLYNAQSKKGVVLDFGLAELNEDVEERILKEKDLNKKDIYLNLIELLRITGGHGLGTEGFMPLEQVLKKEKQGYGVDIWSAGVIFLEFLTGKQQIFRNLRLKKQESGFHRYAGGFTCSLAKIFGKKKIAEAVKDSEYKIILPNDIQEEQLLWTEIVTHPEFDDMTMDLLDKMLRINPNERISALDALSHPFFNK